MELPVKKRQSRFHAFQFRKRPTGIEPASEAWEAPVLPLYYDREDIHQFTSILTRLFITNARSSAFILS